MRIKSNIIFMEQLDKKDNNLPKEKTEPIKKKLKLLRNLLKKLLWKNKTTFQVIKSKKSTRFHKYLSTKED